jgi:hypothetical protein
MPVALGLLMVAALVSLSMPVIGVVLGQIPM